MIMDAINTAAVRWTGHFTPTRKSLLMGSNALSDIRPDCYPVSLLRIVLSRGTQHESCPLNRN